MSTFADPIDVATPAGTGESRRLGDDRMREIKRAFLERLSVEHSMPTAAGSGSGRHKFARGNTAGRPTDVVAGSIYFNTQTGLVEIWDGSAWQNATPGLLALAGGTMTGDLIFENNVIVWAKTAGGTARRVFQRATNNNLLIGESTNKLEMQSGGVDPQPTVSINGGLAQTIWHAGNDGVGSGLDADLIRGIALTLLSQNSQNGYLFFATGYPFIQWGRTTVPADSEVNVTLPVAYPNAHYVAGGFFQDDPDVTLDPDDSCDARVLSNSQVEVWCRVQTGTANRTVNWISIGR